MSAETPLKAPRGLAGLSVADTRISKSEADGPLVIRGYPIEQLAERATFEEAAYLVLYGTLPKRGELDAFKSALNAKAAVPQEVFEIMKGLSDQAHPIDVLRTAVSALGSLDRQPAGVEQRLSICAKMATLVANCYGLPRGEKPVTGRPGLGFSANLLFMLTGKVPDAADSWTFGRELVFYLEHDLNASSFAVRVVASTLADPYAAATAGLAALKGPLHGGANEAAMKMMLHVKDPKRAGPFLDEEFAAKRKVMGFGHRVYKQFDPRARLSKRYLDELTRRKGTPEGRTLYELCVALEEQMWEKKRIPPNLDFYAAPVFHTLGIGIPLYTPIFAASRVFGWMAHYSEQLEGNALIRPDATYVGEKELEFAPLDER